MAIAVCVLSVLVVYLAWNQRQLRRAIAQQNTGLENISQSLVDLFTDKESPITQMHQRSISMDGNLMRAMRVERFINDEQVKALALAGRILSLLDGLNVSEAAVGNGMAVRSAALSVLIDREGLSENAVKNLHVYRAINMAMEHAMDQIEAELREQTAVRELMIEVERVIQQHERQARFSEKLIKARTTLLSAAAMLESHDYASAKAAADSAKWLAIESSPN